MAKHKQNLIFILTVCFFVLVSLTIIINGKKWYRGFCVWFIGSHCPYYSYQDFCFSPDGNMIGTVNSSTMEPVVWNWRDKNTPFAFARMSSDMSFSGDGKYYVAGNRRKKEIILYDLSKRNTIFKCQGIRPCFSNDSKKIVFFDKEDSSQICIWDIAEKSLVSKFEIGTITSIEQHLKPLNNDMGRSLIVFNFSKNFAKVDICDIKDWKSLLSNLKTHNSHEIKLIWDNLDKTSQTAIKKWDDSKPQNIKSKLAIVKGINQILEMKSLYKKASKAGIKPGKKVSNLLKRYPDKLHPSEILDLNRSIICKIFPGEIREFIPVGIKIWDIENSVCLKIIPIELDQSDDPYKYGKYELLTADNTIIITDYSDSQSFFVLDLKKEKIEHIHIEKNICYPEISTDAKKLAFQDYENDIIIFDIDKRKEITKIVPPGNIRILKLRFSPNGKYIATGSIFTGYTGQIDIYETATGKKVKYIGPPKKMVKMREFLLRSLR